MSELSMVETLQLWGEAVTLTEKGNYEDALMKFMSLEQLTDSNQTLITSARNLFNIGQTYFSLGRIDMAIKAFQESIGKDKMLAIAHFMLGCAHIKKNLHRDAQQDFENAYFFLRGNRLIDYTQLGLKYKLYRCEILCNRGISYAKLGNDQKAKSDFLKAMESRVEPRHEGVQDVLLCWQSGKNMTPLIAPSHVVFKPPKNKAQIVSKEKVDYLGKSQVVAARIEDKENNNVPSQKDTEESNPETQAHQPDALNLINERSNLMKDLRKKETRKSLKKIPGVTTRPSALLGLSSPSTPPPRPTSPHPGKRLSNNSMGSSDLSVPPSKPLPPSPRSKSPVPIHRRPLPPNPESPSVRDPMPMRPPKRQGRTVNFQLVISRTVQVNNDSTLNQLSLAAAKALGVSEDTFYLCINRDGEVSAIDDESLSTLWNTESKPTIYCYEKK